MSETKFTPGPWEAVSFNGNSFVVTELIVNEKESIALLGTCGEKQQANAHLIAAAPDMYEALENILNLASTETTKGELVYVDFTEIRIAIKKARGEQ